MSTFAARLQKAIDDQPRLGRQGGRRLFSRRMQERRAKGAHLSNITKYLEGSEPSLEFIQAAAEVLGVRAAWLAWGTGEQTEEAEAQSRSEGASGLRASTAAIVAAIGASADFFQSFEGFAPVVERAARNLLEYREELRLMRGEEPLFTDPTGYVTAQQEAREKVAAAIAAPLRALAVNASLIGSGAPVTRYVEAVAVAIGHALADFSEAIERRVEG